MADLSRRPSGAFHQATSWLPGMVITLLTRLASRMKEAARWNSPALDRWLRSPEMATTSYFIVWINCSIASICSGTAGQPKCRSETWKTVVTSRPALWRDDQIRETRRDAGRERGRKRSHRRARHFARPFDQGHP